MLVTLKQEENGCQLVNFIKKKTYYYKRGGRGRPTFQLELKFCLSTYLTHKFEENSNSKQYDTDTACVIADEELQR